jgi:hypothetical protein
MLNKVHLDEHEQISEALQQGWEPFAVSGSYVYFRKSAFVERDEKATDRP